MYVMYYSSIVAGLPTDRPTSTTERPTDFSQSVLTKPQKKAYGQLFQPKIDIKGELTMNDS